MVIYKHFSIAVLDLCVILRSALFVQIFYEQNKKRPQAGPLISGRYRLGFGSCLLYSQVVDDQSKSDLVDRVCDVVDQCMVGKFDLDRVGSSGEGHGLHSGTSLWRHETCNM